MTVDVLTADQVADMLCCATTTIEERARLGDLPGLKFGSGWVFPAGALARRLDELALEESATRRSPPPQPSAVLRVVPKSKARRSPPALPVV